MRVWRGEIEELRALLFWERLDGWVMSSRDRGVIDSSIKRFTHRMGTREGVF